MAWPLQGDKRPRHFSNISVKRSNILEDQTLVIIVKWNTSKQKDEKKIDISKLINRKVPQYHMLYTRHVFQ